MCDVLSILSIYSECNSYDVLDRFLCNKQSLVILSSANCSNYANEIIKPGL